MNRHVKPVAKKSRFRLGAPLDFSKHTPIDPKWRWLAAASLALSALPLTLALPVGWLFALRIVAVCALGAWRPQPLFSRIGLLLFDLMLMLWWMVDGHSQSIEQATLAIFLLGLSFKAMDINTVGDGYAASVICFFGPFLALAQGLPWWIAGLSSLSLLVALVLRSGLACIESGTPAGLPWDKKHWRPVLGLGLMTVPIALAAFFLLPRIHSPWWGGESGSRTGMSDTMSPGSFDSMLRDPSPAMWVSFKNGQPSKSDLYWRAATLSLFDGRTWTQLPLSPAAENLPVQQDDTRTFSYEMSVLPQQSNFVPFLDRVLSVGTKNAISTYTLTYVSLEKERATQTYSAVSSPNVPWSAERLSDQALQANLYLPEGFNPKTIALVTKWQEDGLLGRAMVDRALAYLRDNMTYSYSPPLLGRHSVDELLFRTREGFCEHFSSSFTVMMRAAGIPSRVVTGYWGGQSSGGRWEVRQLDAHAWAEVWLEGEGWVRIDPTFSVVRERPAPPGEAEASRFDFPIVQWVGEQSSRWVSGFNARSQQELFSDWDPGEWSHWLLALLAVLVILAWTLSAFWIDWSTLRSPPEIVQFAKLRKKLLAASGLGPSATPRQLAKAMEGKLDPIAFAQLSSALSEWEDWRYAGAPSEGLTEKLRLARKALRRSARPEK